MERFIINPQSISPSEIKADLLAYLESKPDFLRWKDFLASSAGQIIIDYIVGYAAFLIYHITVARREAYLTHAENRSSHIAISQNLSYSTFRGRNPILNITFQAQNQPIIFTKWQEIGEVNETSILVLEDTIINTGDFAVVPCIIGNILEETILVDSNIKKPFRFRNSNVSNDIRLYQNNQELQFADRIKELTNNKHVLISNPFGAVDLYYLNDAEPFYSTGDTFRINYIELQDLEFDLTQVLIEPTGVANIELGPRYIAPESNEAIKVNAPLYFETQYQIRGRNDFKKIFKTLDPRLIQTNGRDYTPSVVELTYLKDTLKFYSDAEKLEFKEELESDLPYGSITSQISNPKRVDFAYDIRISLNRTTTDDIPQALRNILSRYEKQFQIVIDKEEIENRINALPYIKATRVTDRLLTWAPNTFYRRVQFTVENQDCGEPKFEFLRHIRRSGTTEPLWPLEAGQRITDGRVVWEARDDKLCNLPAWTPNTSYQEGDLVKPTTPSELIFAVVGTLNLSSTGDPNWDMTEFSLTNDFELVWQAIEEDNITQLWQPAVNYEIGDVVLPFVDAPFAVQVVAYRSRSGSSFPVVPAAPNITFNDGDIVWITRDRDFFPTITNWNEYSFINFNLTVGP